MKAHKIRLALFIGVLLISLFLLLAAWLPLRRERQTTPLPTITLPTPSAWVVPAAQGAACL